MRFICDAKICVAPARNNRPCNCSGTFRSSRAKKSAHCKKRVSINRVVCGHPRKKCPAAKKLLSEAKNVLDAKLMVGSLKSLKPVNCNSESFCCWCSRAKKLKNGFRDNRLEMFFSNKFGFEHFFFATASTLVSTYLFVPYNGVSRNFSPKVKSSNPAFGLIAF